MTESKQTVLLDQYNSLHDEYLADLSASRFQKAGESQLALKALETDIYENTKAMPTSKNSGYLDLKSKMQRVPTAEAQQDHTEEKMNLSKFQYYALIALAAIMMFAAIRLLLLSSEPSKIEAAIFFVVSGLVVFFLFRY